MSEDLHMTSLQIFFSACPELEVSKGLYTNAHFMPSHLSFLAGQLQQSLSVRHPLKPAQYQESPALSEMGGPAPVFVAFPEHFTRAVGGELSSVLPWSGLCLV